MRVRIPPSFNDYEESERLVPTTRELEQLLAIPNEGLTIEHKSWLDLQDDDCKAKIAKSAIALANEGGGIIVFGMREGGSANGGFESHSRPEDIDRYHQDDLNAAINRFAEPALHVELLFASHPTSRVEHAFAVISGGAKVPVMSKRDRASIIASQRCYVRKPGPRSEEPFTAEEWNGVIERCLHQRRETMLDAIRTIVQGHPTPALPVNEQERLLQFIDNTAARWRALRDGLPADAVARMPHGHYELAFEILDVPQAAEFPELIRRLEVARRTRLTGWGPFIELRRDAFAPSIVNEAIEVWLGHASDRPISDSAHSDYWRATLDGRLFLLRGYDEDSQPPPPAGSVIDVTLPVWRVGEALLFVSRLALLFDHNPNIRLICRYKGLAGRSLTSLSGRRDLIDGRPCRDDDIELVTVATAREIDDNLVEILHQLLGPLYLRFDFFELPIRLVQEEVERMRSGRY